MLNLSTLESVIQQKVDALGPAATEKDLLLLSKAIEAAVGNVTVSRICAKGATALVDIESARQAGIADVGAASTTETARVHQAGDQAVHDVTVAGNQQLTAIQGVFDPTAYVKKRSMQGYTFETVDVNTLNTVGETRYVDAANSPNAPAGGAGYGYYMGVAGGDAGGALGLQHFAAQNGRYWWRDKYGGGWREFWHSGNVTISETATASSVTKRTASGSIAATDMFMRTSAAAGGAQCVIGSDADAFDSYFHMGGSSNSTLAGPRSLSLVVNVGGFGIYANRLSPSPRMLMDPTGQFTFFKSVNPDPVSVPFASTIALNFAASNRFDLIATGSFTLANPSGMKPGQVVVLNVTCQAANIVMATGSVFKTRGGAGAALSLTAGANDKVVMECVNAGRIDISVQQDWR
ncbi:hypothetical protein ABMY26_06435 (plasmid) [Azospirillum sp. HJ39]|uniref:hypothetical protein n=1 Tax=Azospirillum sp. HJ39 TaxID=3159496 RepID=UPI00355670C9